MADHEVAGPKKQEKADKTRRAGGLDSQPMFQNLTMPDITSYMIGETSLNPSLQNHAALLSRASSDQRAIIARQLQTTYGNGYLQRLVRQMAIQAKLTVSGPSDSYDREAERIAEAVTKEPGSQVQKLPQKHTIQRDTADPSRCLPDLSTSTVKQDVTLQSQITKEPVPRGMIQRTGAADVLNSFFSPYFLENLWVMPENDEYTRIVQTWEPVIEAVNQAKENLAPSCYDWQTRHMTDPSWHPRMSPAADPNAYKIEKSSPLGTNSDACKRAWLIYKLTGIQTDELHTASIGSFDIYVTADNIDCQAKTARLNIWMYNAMSEASFGRFAGYFRRVGMLAQMATQYMWWNWHELYNFQQPRPPGGW